MSWVCESFDDFGNRQSTYCDTKYAAETEAGYLASGGRFARVMEIRPKTKTQYRFIGPWIDHTGVVTPLNGWDMETREVPA